MKVLVIPDVHLKGWMFDRADEFLKEGYGERAVCLMDIPDDWGMEFDLQAYRDTFERMIAFAQKYPDTLWCWGNHDLSYVWDLTESGYSHTAKYLVNEYLAKFRYAVSEENLACIHRMDDTLFMHGGLAESFVKYCVCTDGVDHDDADSVIERINTFGKDIMWSMTSPIWFRPQYDPRKLYMQEVFLQVVGHTPVKEIRMSRGNSLLSCDVFSTYRNHTPIGPEVFPLVDTVDKTFSWVK